MVQSGATVGGAQSLKSSVTILLKICCLSWFASLVRLGSPGCVWVPSVVVGRVTPTVVSDLQHGHCLAWRWGRWCMCKLPMLAPSASRRDAALVASILSMDRDVSVACPARSRAFVGLESAVNSAVFVRSSSSCIASGFSGSVVVGRCCGFTYSK